MVLVAHNIVVTVVLAIIGVVITMVGLSNAWVVAFPMDRPRVHL